MNTQVIWIVAIFFFASVSSSFNINGQIYISNPLLNIFQCNGAKPEEVSLPINRPLPPKVNLESTTELLSQASFRIKAPLVDNLPAESTKPEFAPGTIISGLTRPLNRFRNAFIDRIFPSIKRPSLARQEDTGTAVPAAAVYVTDCTTNSGLFCYDCTSLVVSRYQEKIVPFPLNPFLLYPGVQYGGD